MRRSDDRRDACPGGLDRPIRGTRRLALVLPLLLAGCDGWPESTRPQAPAPPPPGSVARGDAARRAALAPPGPPVDAALLELGAQRYAIYCTPCHGARGAGDGPVVARGYPQPPPLPADALRSMAAIAANQAGAHPFDDRIASRERWAIARFVETLPGRTP